MFVTKITVTSLLTTDDADVLNTILVRSLVNHIPGYSINARVFC
jgi:hypothetical protein